MVHKIPKIQSPVVFDIHVHSNKTYQYIITLKASIFINVYKMIFILRFMRLDAYILILYDESNIFNNINIK